MFKLKNKYKIYRRFSIDLWCRLVEKTGMTKAAVRCFDRKRRRLPFRSLVSSIFKKRRLLSIFYGGLSSKDYRIGLGVESFTLSKLKKSVLQWESRIPTIVYRSNFANTLFQANSLVISGLVSVNKEIIKSRNYLVSPGDVVELIDSIKEEFFIRLLRRLPLVFIFNPYNMEINYVAMCVCLLKPRNLYALTKQSQNTPAPNRRYSSPYTNKQDPFNYNISS